MSVINQMKAAAAGVAGAGALALLEEGSKILSPETAPLSKGSGEENEFKLAGELALNGLYFGLTGLFGKRHPVLAGFVLGTAAGVGVALFPEKMGLAARDGVTPGTKALQVVLYAVGGVAAGLTYAALLGEEE